MKMFASRKYTSRVEPQAARHRQNQRTSILSSASGGFDTSRCVGYLFVFSVMVKVTWSVPLPRVSLSTQGSVGSCTNRECAE